MHLGRWFGLGLRIVGASLQPTNFCLTSFTSRRLGLANASRKSSTQQVPNRWKEFGIKVNQRWHHTETNILHVRPATAPVNWNSSDEPDYRASTPYPELLKAMRTAGYVAIEWAQEWPIDPEIFETDVKTYDLTLLG